MLTSIETKKLEDDLRSAVDEENFEKVKEYVKKAKKAEAATLNSNVIINSKDRNGNSPLSIAVNKNNLEITRFLIENGASVHIENYFHLPLICSAVMDGATEMIELLIDKGAKISGYFSYAGKKRTLVGWAIDDNNAEKVEVLLKRGASPNGKFNLLAYSQNSCLHAAVENRYSRIVELLIEHNADVNVKNEHGQTPIYLAIKSKYSEIIKLLYDNGADIDNVKDVMNETASDYVKLFYPGKTIKEIAAEAEGVNVNPDDTISAPSSAVKPSSFINSMLNWIGSSTTVALSSLFHSAPALPPAQQSVSHSAESPINSSQVDLYGTVLLADVTIKKLTGKKYLKPLDDSLLTIEEIKGRKLSAMKENFDMAINKYEKLDQCPGSLLSNSTIYKGAHHQKFF